MLNLAAGYGTHQQAGGKNKRHGNMNNTLIIKLTAFLTALLCMASCTVGGDDDNEYGKGMLEEGTIAPDFMIYTDSRPEASRSARCADSMF